MGHVVRRERRRAVGANGGGGAERDGDGAQVRRRGGRRTRSRAAGSTWVHYAPVRAKLTMWYRISRAQDSWTRGTLCTF